MLLLGLKRGDVGEGARQLRVWLNLHCGARLPALPEVDAITVAALRRFQQDHGIPPTGEVDATTEAAILYEERGFQTAAWRAGAVLPPVLQVGTPAEG